MMLKYHRLPFVGKLVMSAGEATEAAETTANTAKPGGTAEATAQTTQAANASDSAAHHHLVLHLNCAERLRLVRDLSRALAG
jgi:cellobiose-specific phosphotransferase system component IIA